MAEVKGTTAGSDSTLESKTTLSGSPGDSNAVNSSAPKEGYEWDPVRQGYFPKIDEDFIAYYQASYGFVEEDGEVKAAPTVPVEADSSLSAQGAALQSAQPASQQSCSQSTPSEATHAEAAVPAVAPSENGEEGKTQGQSKKRKAANDPSWFDMEETKNNNIYVSGLPLDYTEQEFYDLMSKCGIVKDDEDSEEPKIKLYRTADGQLKGDGRCCYLKHESVALALQILDGSMVGSSTIAVQPAVFERHGDFNPSLRKKKKPKKKNKKSVQDKLLGWNEPKKGPMRKKSDKIVIFRHCFDPKEFEEDACLITEIRDEIKVECEKCGPVHKVMVFDRHPEGVLSVAFKDFEGPDNCVTMMNGRWYGGRQLEVAIWDGVTSYQIEETDLERVDRLSKWEDFISSSSEQTDAAQTETSSTDAS